MPITRSKSHPEEDSSDVPEHRAASTGEEDTSAREGTRSPLRGATGSPRRGSHQSPDHERSESPDPMEQYARTKMRKSEIELEEKIVSLRRYAYELEIQKRRVTRDLEEMENRKLPPNILQSWSKSGGNPRLTSPNREQPSRPEERERSSPPVPVSSPIPQVTIEDSHSSAAPRGGTEKSQGKSGYEEIVHGLKKMFPELEAPKAAVGCPHSSCGAEKRNLRVDSYAITSYVMKLPDFHGEINAWPSYKSIYEQSKDSFSRFENIVRLRKSIKGEALQRVEVLFAANADAEVIIKEMDREYGRTGQLAFKEFNALKDLPPLVNKPAAIVRFAQKVRRTVLLFKTLGEDNYLRSPELMQYLQVKLPDNMRSEWRKIQWQHNSKATLEHFQEFLDQQAEYCTVDLPMDMKLSTTRQSTHRTHTVMEDSDSEEEKKTASKQPAARGKEKPVERKSDPRCRVCMSNGHWTLDCPTFANANSEKRWELARKHQLCFRCLHNRAAGHRCKTLRCGVSDCKATHHRLLHFEKRGKEKTETVTNTWEEKAPQVYLKMVPVTVVGPAGESDEFALLDDGSTVSLVDEAVAAGVGAEGTADPLRLETMGESIKMPQPKRITVTLSTRQGDKIDFSARTVPSLSLSPQTITERDLADCKHLQRIKKELVYKGAAPRILIGQDNWNLLLAKETVKGPDTQPIASLTALGWVLHGSHTRAIGHRVMYANSPSVETDINKKLEEFFSLESLLIKPRRPDSDPEKRAEDILKKNTRITPDNRIETALLWKEDTFEMPNNYDNALTRLRGVEKRIDKDPELKQKYTEQMDSLIDKGYAEPAPKVSTQGKTWYLPHFDVKNPAKPEKFRIVHDAAAKTRGKSLNDFLLAGPDLLKSLPGVLMRFRQHPIAVSADIVHASTSMFMQIKIRPEDRDALRYLWRGDRRDGAPQEYRMTSLIFGAASSPCTAIFAKDWNAKRYEAEYPAAVTAITENHYMDDYLDSFSSVEQAIETSRKVREIHSEAHLELRKWISNSPEVVEQIEPTTETTSEVHIGSKEEKILGLMWNPATDELGFNMKMARLPAGILDKQTVTKREALKTVMSLYDPLGFASPVTVNAKKILQESWRRSTDWDQELDDDLTAQWNEWKQHLQNLKSVTIPRCYTGYSHAVTIQLHVFTDASETAYAAVT